jgi:hypothetical protein
VLLFFLIEWKEAPQYFNEKSRFHVYRNGFSFIARQPTFQNPNQNALTMFSKTDTYYVARL